MKTILKLLRFGIIASTLSSCEPFFGSVIRNESTGPIQIILEFDKTTLEDAWGESPYIPFLSTFALDEGISIVDFDTVNLITKYEVSPNVSFSVESGQGVKPDYELLKKITIISDDTLSLDGRKEIEAAFEHVEKYRWRLTVK